MTRHSELSGLLEHDEIARRFRQTNLTRLVRRMNERLMKKASATSITNKPSKGFANTETK